MNIGKWTRPLGAVTLMLLLAQAGAAQETLKLGISAPISGSFRSSSSMCSMCTIVKKLLLEDGRREPPPDHKAQRKYSG